MEWLVRQSVVTALLLLAASTVMSAQPADHNQTHGHTRNQHDGSVTDSGTLSLQLNSGERWATDESLRTGMTDIRSAFEVRHREYENGTFNTEKAASLADTIEERVHFMIANCKLPPAADAELHKLLAASLAAAGTLRKADDPHTGLHALHRVLNTYPRYFDHPGWDD